MVRSPVTAVACIAAAVFVPAAVYAQTCGADMPGAQRAESVRYTVAFRLVPPAPALSKHFSVEVAICPKGGAPEPEALRVDARMPAHGHGMNYTAQVKSLGGARYRADGLLFHMPGQWEFLFDVVIGKTAERVTYGISYP
jgi:hypothetical protein